MMASSPLIWFPIVLYIDLEGESFWYQCYICQFSCVYMVYQNMWGGCRKTLFILGKIKQFFFNERSILVKLLSVFWQFWLHNLLLDLSTIFLTCIMFWVSLLRHKKRLDVLSTHRFPPSKGYESDSTLFSIVSNSFHPSPHFGIVVKVTVFTF